MRTAAATGPWLLEPARRRYAWGSPSALFELLGEVPDGEPMAELWYGAHPAGSSVVPAGGGVTLESLVAADPEGTLGAVAGRWDGCLPFMVKLIAAAQPLSIQVHPDAEHAARGFADEATRGVPLAERRFQDPSAKPEVVCALADFDALIGFRPVDAIARDFAAAGLAALAEAVVGEQGIAAVVQQVLSADAQTAGRMIESLASRSSLASRLASLYPNDPGVVVAEMLNRVRLAPGDAVFLAPGAVHAYLGGLAVEVMATSDNVLRAGLTSKLVDVDAFLRVARLDPSAPDVLRPDESGTYPQRAAEFTLRRHRGGDSAELHGPAVVVCTAGSVSLGELTLRPGAGAFVPAAGPAPRLTGTGEAFVATVGEPD
ncbi:MAG TPA: mannose-6-phosphate isomerase, class I [Acidimicrobiales bacterium]